MKFLAPALLMLASLGLLSCADVREKTAHANREFVVDPYWVQDTLARPNGGFRKINRMSPLIYKNSIVVGNALDGLVSFDLTSKNSNWRVPIPYGVEASGAMIKDRLFVGSNNGKMYSIDLVSSETVWVFDTKSELVSEPLLSEGVLYFISGSQSLYAVDAATGKQLWTHNRQDTSSNMTIRGGAKPSLAGNILYAGFSDGALVAINSKTGTEQWEITLNRNTRFKDIDASPVIDGDYIYVNSYDDKVYCLSREKGEVIWSAKFGGVSSPLIIGDKVLVTSSKGEMAALAKKDGAVLWTLKSKLGILTDPVMYNNLLVAGESQGRLLFIEPETGVIVGHFEPGRGVFSKPTAYGDSIYFISGEGNVYGVTGRYNEKSSIYYLK